MIYTYIGEPPSPPPSLGLRTLLPPCPQNRQIQEKIETKHPLHCSCQQIIESYNPRLAHAIMASRRTSNALHAVTKNYNNKFGPLPQLAINYILLKNEVDSAETARRNAAAFETRISGEYQAPVKSKNLMQNKSQLTLMAMQLRTHTHLYRSPEHMDEVLYLLFPEFYEQRPKEVPVAAEAAPIVYAPVVVQPPKPSNDAWDMY